MLYLTANMAYTRGDRRRDCRSKRRRDNRRDSSPVCTGDRRGDEHLFNRATNRRFSPRRSPVMYTRGDRRGDDRRQSPRRSLRTVAATIAPCIRPITYNKSSLFCLFIVDAVQHCRLAKKFESLVATDDRFEVIGKVNLGLVCLRLKVSEKQTARHTRIVK